jgi:16S rRNA (guanine527-N7)-methyltransferase
VESIEGLNQRELLRKGSVRLGLDLSDEQIDSLVAYVGEIELWNPRKNLVAATGHELIVRHILDSLSGVRSIRGCMGRDPATVEDAGSGAGLPGIPLAIALPHFRFILVERGGARAGFLRNACATLRLPNVEVLEADAFEVNNQVDCLVYRAFVPVSIDLIHQLVGKVVESGWLVIYRGRQITAESELEEIRQSAAFSQSALIPVRVPYLDEERHLVTVKRASTAL